jgi:hypothetical protein
MLVSITDGHDEKPFVGYLIVVSLEINRRKLAFIRGGTTDGHQASNNQWQFSRRYQESQDRTSAI